MSDEAATINPELAGLQGLAAQLEQSAAAEAAPPAPQVDDPSESSLAIATLGVHTLGVVLARGFRSDHWTFAPDEVRALAPPWARIIDLYFPDAQASPWFMVALTTGPALAVRYAQQQALMREARAARDAADPSAPSDNNPDGFAPSAAARFG